MTWYTAGQALIRARSWGHYYGAGMCARFVSDCVSGGRFGYPQIRNANDAWRLATRKHYDHNHPPGVPVYWGPNHVAISRGPGGVRSTDYPTDTRLGDCSDTQMGVRWPRMFYRGWSEDWAGDIIPGIVYPTAILQRGSNNVSVRKLQAGLIRVFPDYARARLVANGGPTTAYGPATEAVVKEFQRRSGLYANGVIDAVTRVALSKYGIVF